MLQPDSMLKPGFLHANRAIQWFMLTLIACGVFLGLGTPRAWADEYIDRVNAFYADIRPELRSDPIILEALAQMDPVPAAVGSPDKAALLPASADSWNQVSDWATAEHQVAVLEAIDKVTKDTGTKRAMAFGQPYGIAALGSDPKQIKFIAAGLYTDLGDPPLLAAAQIKYLPKFDDIASLVHVEATRRLAQGDAAGALDVLTDWLWFARQIADREFFKEKHWAFQSMTQTARRIRDVVYNDSIGSKTLTPDEIKEALDRLLDYRGPIATDRIQLGRADFIAAEQLIETVFGNSDTIDVQIFAPTMARLASTRRPLRLFGEASRWESIAQRHANRKGTLEALEALKGDYQFRWTRKPFDPLLDQPYAADGYMSNTLLSNAVATVTRSLPDMRVLFDDRVLFKVELVGTRQAMALDGFHRENGAFPLDIAGVRPRFLVKLEADPLNPNRDRGQKPPMKYYVPIRDTKDRFAPGQTPEPQTISIITDGSENIQIKVDDSQFVLYSVGADGSPQWADVVQNTLDAPPGRDYLIWPPVLSVERITMMQAGAFK